MSLLLFLVAVVAALAFVSLGGGFYEVLVVDPAWPRQPALIQPDRGGVSRKRFWIPAHTVFELALVVALVMSWSHTAVRLPLLVAFGSHLLMRAWSAVDFIPKALKFERTEPSAIDEREARRWTRRSAGRLPLDLITGTAAIVALVAAARLTPA